MSNPEIYNTRNAGMKPEISDMKNDFMKSLDSLKDCVHYIFASLFCMSVREHL